MSKIYKTTVILREMSADEQIREEARHREKRLHDEATARYHVRAEGRFERDAGLAEMWCKKGYTEEQIRVLLGE